MLMKQQAEFTKDVSKLIQYIFSKGYYCTFGEAYRTKEQAEIYAKSGKGIRDSLHCNRLAIDLNLYNSTGEYLTKTENYKEFGEYWESLDVSNRWGGRFSTIPDGNHFERKTK